MISIVLVVAYLLLIIATIVSNKSTFKILFNFMSTLLVYGYLINNGYKYAQHFFIFILFFYFITLVFVKFSQTGKRRVLPSTRNFYSNNIIPVLSILFSSVFILLILRSVEGDLFTRKFSVVDTKIESYLSYDIKFISLYAILILIIYVFRRIRS